MCTRARVCVYEAQSCRNDLTDESNTLRYLLEWSQEIKVQVGEKQKRDGVERKKHCPRICPC